MSDSRAVLLEATHHALKGDWQRAHEVAQEHEGDPIANWLHGAVHWMEGDLSNARYWFGRAGKELDLSGSPEQTLRAIEAALRG